MTNRAAGGSLPRMNAPLLAAVSEPAPPGQSSPLGIAIILLCVAVGIAFAVLAAIRRRR